MNTKKVKSIRSIGSGEVFDITVKDNENYVLENGVVTHNSGLLYSASTIIELSKSKELEGKDVIGNVITAKTFKSRLTKENQSVNVRLYYDSRGLDKYYGLLDLGEESGIIPRIANKYEIDGKKYFKKTIYENPEKYFTGEIMQKLEEYTQKKFKYGSSTIDNVDVENPDELEVDD